jgi:methanogenic corrinoid protein MtbC1
VKRLLSPRDLADAIGVSESSLKRWADAGRIQVSRTEGGHRRIPIAEAVRFIRASGVTVVRPELLGMHELEIEPRPDPEDTLYRLLHEGLGREVRGMVMGRFLAGESVAALADGPIRAAMTRLGALWKHDPRGVFIEHRATDCCMQAVNALRALFDPPDDAPVAVGGAPSSDPYVLPSLLAATVLAAEGMKVVNLGPDTPIASMRHAVAAHHPALVWLSCSVPVADDVVAEVVGLARSLRTDGATLLVGGRHVADLAAARAAFAIGTMSELAAFARGVIARTPAPAQSG